MLCITSLWSAYQWPESSSINYENSSILIPDEESIDIFEAKIRGILSNMIKLFEIKHIKAFSFCDYYTEKKLYLSIYAVNTKQRKIAIKAIQKKKYITASDDQFTYYRKVACECGILLSR